LWSEGLLPRFWRVLLGSNFPPCPTSGWPSTLVLPVFAPELQFSWSDADLRPPGLIRCTLLHLNWSCEASWLAARLNLAWSEGASSSWSWKRNWAPCFSNSPMSEVLGVLLKKILLLGSLPRKGCNNYCAPWRARTPDEYRGSSIWIGYLLREILSCVNYWGIKDIWLLSDIILSVVRCSSYTTRRTLLSAGYGKLQGLESRRNVRSITVVNRVLLVWSPDYPYNYVIR
jgi:hypothetical protein